MDLRKNTGWLAGVAALALLAGAGCVVGDDERARGTFERTVDVPARVRVEVRNGSGNTTIVPGPAGRVHVRAEVRATGVFGNAERRVEQVTSNPPIELAGSLLRIGPPRVSNVRITYSIEVPTDAVLHVDSGSGDVEARGVEGPVRLSTGSGDVSASSIRQSVELSTGSGDVRMEDAGGTVEISTGSGDVDVSGVAGDLRGRTGSGDITVTRPGGRVDVRTSSGSVEVRGASADLRVKTGSGDCTIEGNPQRASLWEIDTSSGDIELDLPGSASFVLHVIGRGRIDTGLDLVMEEQSRRELRARRGGGDARIRAETSSGSVRIR